MYCVKCGNLIKSGHYFCTLCGEKCKSSEEIDDLTNGFSKEDSYIFCDSCGKIIYDKRQSFCCFCGEKYDYDTAYEGVPRDSLCAARNYWNQFQQSDENFFGELELGNLLGDSFNISIMQFVLNLNVFNEIAITAAEIEELCFIFNVDENTVRSILERPTQLSDQIKIECTKRINYWYAANFSKEELDATIELYEFIGNYFINRYAGVRYGDNTDEFHTYNVEFVKCLKQLNDNIKEKYF